MGKTAFTVSRFPLLRRTTTVLKSSRAFGINDRRGYVTQEAHMPGDADQCRIYAARYLALGERAWRPEVRAAFTELAQTWKRLAAETESDQALLRAISEMDLGEPYEDLPLALNLYAWAA
jgi:hypothetical protein